MTQSAGFLRRVQIRKRIGDGKSYGKDICVFPYGLFFVRGDDRQAGIVIRQFIAIV